MEDLKKGSNPRLGHYVPTVVGGKPAQAFIPPPLPPDPALDLTNLLPLLEQAHLAVGKLDGLAQTLPDIDRFIYAYVRKEALVSSQIEGTQSSLSDLLLHEIDAVPGVAAGDVEEVSNYIAAIRYGVQKVRDEQFPVTLNLLRDLHRMLMHGQRGQNKDPGEFRRSQVWLQDAYGRVGFVPPTWDMVVPLLGDMEKYINEENPQLPVIIKAALAHAQFETIHPFHDGNGRLGRLLIMLMLSAGEVMHEPILYLSLYFKVNRDAYYDALDQIRRTGAWEEWVAFFLKGVVEVAGQAIDTARALSALFSADRARILARPGRGHANAIRVHDLLQKQVYGSVPNVEKELGITAPTARAALNELVTIGIVKEVTGNQRNRIYVYEKTLELLQLGAEPIR
jgi:Fic family protein